MEEESENHQNKEEEEEIKLSKNQLKKLKKAKDWEEIKLKKKELKKLQKNNKRKSSEIEEIEEKEEEEEEGKSNNEKSEEALQERKLFKEQCKNEFKLKCQSNYSIVIDCSWENEHTDSTLKSLTQQIMFCYGINRRSDHPSQLFITGVGQRTSTLLAKNNCQSWQCASIHQNDFLEVISNYYQELKQFNSESHLNLPENPLNNIIYLTSDATEVIEELNDNYVYIIGGIVDRNRLKGITYNKANTLNIRTAKLPIKEYYNMKATHILTVNHVFDILKQFSHYKSWTKAIEHVLPVRKGAQLHNNNNNNNNDEEQEENEEENKESSEENKQSSEEQIENKENKE